MAWNRPNQQWTLILIVGICVTASGSARGQLTNDPVSSVGPTDRLSTTDNNPSPLLVVLGTVQDGGFPHIGCRRPCCAAAWRDPSRQQFVTSWGLIDRQARQRWVIEATPDLAHQLELLDQWHPQNRGVECDGILVTHAHIGHYAGLMFLGREALGAQDVPVYAMPRMRRFLELAGPWSQLVEFKNITLRPLEANTTQQLNEQISITPFLVPHRDEFSETVAFIIQGPRRRALLLPDIDKWEKFSGDINQLIRSVDYAFLDGTFFDASELPGRDLKEIPHPLILESLERFAALDAADRDKVHFIHLNHTNPVLRPDSSESQQVIKHGCHIARQGDCFEL